MLSQDEKVMLWRNFHRHLYLYLALYKCLILTKNKTFEVRKHGYNASLTIKSLQKWWMSSEVACLVLSTSHSHPLTTTRVAWSFGRVRNITCTLNLSWILTISGAVEYDATFPLVTPGRLLPITGNSKEKTKGVKFCKKTFITLLLIDSKKTSLLSQLLNSVNFLRLRSYRKWTCISQF